VSVHVTERLSAYMDAELERQDRAEVETHLKECASCAHYLEELVALDRAARALPAEAPPDYFEALPARLRGRLSPKRRPFVLPAWTWAAAAAVLLVVVTPLMLREGMNERVAPPPEAAPSSAPPAPAEVRGAPVEEPTPLKAAPPRAEGRSRAAPKTPSAPRPAPKDEAYSPGRGGSERLEYSGGEESDRAFQSPGALSPEKERPTAEAAQGGAEGTRAVARSVGPVRDKEPKPAQRMAVASLPEARLDALLSETPATAEEARDLRESFRALAQQEGPRLDEARVHVILAGAEAYRLSRDPRDLKVLQKDAAAYLQLKDAPQADRVRGVLNSLPR
jgi:hypothetical protein